MPGRQFTAANSTAYRYGFNGKENDNDIEAGAQDYGMRVYDSRIGKFLSVDPLQRKFPFYTPYQFAGNTPIEAIDLDGLEPFRVTALRGLSSITGKITGYGAGGAYNATTHIVSLASGIVVDPDGNVLAFKQTGGLAATLDFANGGASSDVSISFSLSFTIFNNRISKLSDVLGPFRQFTAGINFLEIGSASISAEMSSDGKKNLGATVQIGMGFGAGTPLTLSSQETNTVGVIYSRSEYNWINKLSDDYAAKVLTDINNYNYQQTLIAGQETGHQDFAHALWQADNGGKSWVSYELIEGNRYEIVIITSFWVHANQLMIPKGADPSKFKDTEIRSINKTGVFLTKDKDGNYITDGYQGYLEKKSTNTNDDEGYQ